MWQLESIKVAKQKLPFRDVQAHLMILPFNRATVFYTAGGPHRKYTAGPFPAGPGPSSDFKGGSWVSTDHRAPFGAELIVKLASINRRYLQRPFASPRPGQFRLR